MQRGISTSEWPPPGVTMVIAVMIVFTMIALAVIVVHRAEPEEFAQLILGKIVGRYAMTHEIHM